MRERRRDRSRFAIALAMGALLAVFTGCAVGAPPFPTLATWDDRGSRAPTLEPDEQKLWDEAKEGLEKLVASKEYFEDAALVAYLQSVISRLAPPIVAGGPKLAIHVSQSVEDNAGALPDGTIVIALPLLVGFRNESQLAFVLAHEIVHVMNRHAVISTRYDALTSSHVERMRLSRRLEADADGGAIRLMAAAGYDPREAAAALTHVVESTPGSPHTIRAWNSHDFLPNRLAVVRRSVALVGKGDGEPGVESFERAMDPCRLRAAELELEADRFDVALAFVTHHLERLPKSGSAYTLRAQITRRKDPAERLSSAVGDDLERGVEYAPDDPDSLRALGLFLRDTGDTVRSAEMLQRYLEVRPDAYDRKLIERYFAPASK